MLRHSVKFPTGREVNKIHRTTLSLHLATVTTPIARASLSEIRPLAVLSLSIHERVKSALLAQWLYSITGRLHGRCDKYEC